MANGTVKWFNKTKGYGFIEPKDGSKDVFVHISAVENSRLNNLQEHQQVSYDVESNGDRTSAVNIQLLDS